MSKLQGKVAVVTGASKGIGAAIARALGAAGASVVVNYASDQAGADKAVADIKAGGGKAIAVQGDVSRAGDVKRLFEETRKTFGKLDVLVNNAGVFRFAPIEETSEAEYQRQFGINVLGPLLATREALPLFGSEGGSVINISSIVSRMGIRGFGRLCRHKGRAGQHHPGAGVGTWSAQDPGQFHQSRHGGKRRHTRRRIHRRRLPEEYRGASARSAASASRTMSPRLQSSWPVTSPAG